MKEVFCSYGAVALCNVPCNLSVLLFCGVIMKAKLQETFFCDITCCYSIRWEVHSKASHTDESVLTEKYFVFVFDHHMSDNTSFPAC